MSDQDSLKDIYHRLICAGEMEIYTRRTFDCFLHQPEIFASKDILSVSTGDASWDYQTLITLPQAKIIATDIVDNPVDHSDLDLLENNKRWFFQKVTPEKSLPFVDNQFDLVYHFDVLEHVQKPYLFLSEQYRVLKKGGYLLVCTPNLLRLGNLLKLMIGRLTFPVCIGNREKIGEYIHVQEYTSWTLDNLLREIGFTITDTQMIYSNIPGTNIKVNFLCKHPFFENVRHNIFIVAKK